MTTQLDLRATGARVSRPVLERRVTVDLVAFATQTTTGIGLQTVPRGAISGANRRGSAWRRSMGLRGGVAKGRSKSLSPEAVRAGFKAAYDARDCRTIVDVAVKLPEVVVQEDEKLAMYVDVASMRVESVQQPKLF